MLVYIRLAGLDRHVANSIKWKDLSGHCGHHSEAIALITSDIANTAHINIHFREL
jgi:hypothetical protein